jgi:serine/threonine protein kinase
MCKLTTGPSATGIVGEKHDSAEEPGESNLAHFRSDAGSFEALPPGEFTRVKKIANGIHGEVFTYRWAWHGAGDGGNVVVKRLRRRSLLQLEGTETSERRVHFRLPGPLGLRRAPHEEDALTEIGVLRRLAAQPDLPLYLLRMLGVFNDADSETVWLVTEHAEGGELFSEVSERGALPEGEVRRFSWQIFQAVAYLHRHSVAHRDISLENVLLKGGDVRLMDFGMAVQSHSASGELLRYFRAVGKDFYRAPNTYIPKEQTVRLPAAPAARDADGIA